MHDGEHPFNKAKDKHETKQIDHIIGNRSRQRNRAHHSFRSNLLDNNHHHQSGGDEQLFDDNVDQHAGWNGNDYDLHAGIGLHHV